jgi:ArsR family transcriptional regulator
MNQCDLNKRELMNPVQFYKCLWDETRLRCLLLIQQEEELCVCELTEALREIQPKISRHLAQLKKCDLLVGRRQGQWVFYRINPNLPMWAKQVLAVSSESNRPFLQDNHQQLCRMGDRPERMRACVK